MDVNQVNGYRAKNSRISNKKLFILLAGMLVLVVLSFSVRMYKQFLLIKKEGAENLTEATAPGFVSEKTVTLGSDIPNLYGDKSIEMMEKNYIRGRYYKFEGNILELVMDSEPLEAPVVSITMTGSERYFCYPRYRQNSEGERADIFDIFIDTKLFEESLKGNNSTTRVSSGVNYEMLWFKKKVKSGEAVAVMFVNDSENDRIPVEITMYKDNGCAE